MVPLKLSRLFEPYHETEDARERRGAVVALHLDGWSVNAIASYLKVGRKPVYRVIGRWLEEGDEGLAKRAVALWLLSDALAVEHAGETLSRYEVEYWPGRGGLGRARCLELFEGAYDLPQPWLFGLEEALGDGWLKALKLEAYAPRRSRQPEMLQQVLFPYAEAL